MHDFDYVLVGSGPSAAAFLLSDNYKSKSSKFCILDVAFDYKKKFNQEPSKKKLYELHDIHNKTYYGDSLATKKIPKYEFPSNLEISNSYAYGGLSNVWGGACSHYNYDDLEMMGLKINQKYYNLVNKVLNIGQFTFPKESKMLNVYSRLKNNNNTNIYVEPSLLAVNFKKLEPNCSGLYGSSNGAIYNSRETFMNHKGDATISPNTLLDKIIYESSGNIILQIINTNSGERSKIKTKKLILGCGAINTSKLLLKSFKDIESIHIKDSQGFKIPIIDVTLSGLLRKSHDEIELTNFYLKTKINEFRVHGQLYFSGEYIKNQISKQYHIPRIFLSNLLNIIYIYQGYLPSIHSSIGKLTIRNSKFHLTTIKEYDKKFLYELININDYFLRKSKLFQINFMKDISDIFSVYHFGAISLLSNDKNIELDTYDGSIAGYEDIHIIDSSILKDLPSGPLTSIVMANAVNISDKIL
ncbi:MAG: hypothetical protein VX096_04080 [Pseudomonadota bacterium]|nr:hypothetical protein [Pseudomonadota bacterium]